MNYADLIQAIQAQIRDNTTQAITGQILQDILVEMVQELGQAGAVFGGVVDRDFTPAATDSNIFYVASVPGTYSGFGQSVSVGEFAIFYFDGSDWQKATVTSAEVEVTTTGQTGVNLATISVGGQSYQIRAEKKDTTPTVGSSYAVTSDGVASAIATAVNNINNALALKADTTYVDNQLALKADKVAGAVNGNMAALDANGNLVDSGIASSAVGDVANKIDRVAGAGVGNVAMFDAIGGIEDSEVPADNIAQQDGYYSTLIAGAAENLVGQDIQTAQFTRRVSGGSADVGTGVAILKSIKGNTLVWNQLCQNANFANGTTDWNVGDTCTLSASDNELSLTVGSGVQSYTSAYQSIVPYVTGHKYYVSQWVYSPRAVNNYNFGLIYYMQYQNVPANTWQKCSAIITVTGSHTVFRRVFANQLGSNYSPGDILKFKDIIDIDLTAMFGSGNEPSTAAEFEALFPLNYYAYDSGSLLNNKAASLVTTGFNQLGLDRTAETPADSGATTQRNFDEGKYYIGLAYNNVVRSAYVAEQSVTSESVTVKNSGNNNYYGLAFPFKCFPSTAYYLHIESITGGTIAISYYDGEGNFISTAGTVSNNSVITTIANARWMVVCLYPSSNGGTGVFTKPNINLSDVNKNGTYEPYWSETKALPITTMTGKVNGEGESVVMFPDGLRKAGTAFDETNGVKSWDRLIKIDLGSLNWTQYGSGPYSFFYKDDDGIIANNNNATCVNYVTTTNAADINNQSNDKSVYVGTTGYISNTKVSIWIYDSAYGSYTAAQFKTVMNGVSIYVERATPIEYVNDTPLNLQYRVDNDGTETILPENTSTPTTAPFLADIQYAMNAVDTLRNLPKNYISKASMDSILTAFKTAGVITAYTLTWDATNQKYNCTITV